MNNTEKIKVAVIGVGHLGRFHAQKYLQCPDVTLVAVCDTNKERCDAISAELSVPAVYDYESLLKEVDAVSVAVPTFAHFSVVAACLHHGIDVLVEKPFTTTIEQAQGLIKLAKLQQAVLQIGHVERFNPVVSALSDILLKPQFIECVRLAPFKSRGTDVNVILDLMIHDIDIVQSLLHSKPRHIDAIGTPVFTETNDIANARIHYENGCVANFTASRVSLKQERKIRIFQNDAYISLDMLQRQCQIYRADISHSNPFGVIPEHKSFAEEDPLFSEIQAFLHCVRTRATPIVTGEDGEQALAIALAISDSVAKQREYCRQLQQDSAQSVPA